MKKVSVSVKCTPSGDVYEEGFEIDNDKLADIGIRVAVNSILLRAMTEHDIFESYKIEVNPILEA